MFLLLFVVCYVLIERQQRYSLHKILTADDLSNYQRRCPRRMVAL